MALAILFFLAHGAARSQPTEQPIDPHTLYETKCQGCHTEHGADLARQKLTMAKQTLQVSRTGATLDRLLHKHHGVTLSATEATALTVLFTSGIRWSGVFQHRCTKCHGKAVTFARSELTTKDGIVRTKKSNDDVDAFLTKGHGESTPAEIKLLLEMFRYQLDTAPR